MKTFPVPFTEGQGVALLQLMELGLKAGGENVADVYIELRNLIRASAQTARNAENILPAVVN